jgi:hypothetical protein
MTPARAAGGRRRWVVRGASMTGAGHVREGRWCEDAFAWTSLTAGGEQPDIQVLAVADGAGSRARSAEGSRLAVSLAVSEAETYLRRSGLPTSPRLWRENLDVIGREIVTAFRAAARDLGGGSVDAFASTLTTVIVAHPFVAYFSVGDGFVVLRTGTGGSANIHLLDSAVAAAENASTTVFLTSRLDGAARIGAVYDPEITGVFVSTDGLAPATLSRSENGELTIAEVPVVDMVLSLLDQGDFEPYDLLRLLQRDDVLAVTEDDTTMLAAVLRR